MIAEYGHLGCHWCQLPFTRQIRPTIEHLLPTARGGTNERSNLVLACSSCNRWRKHGDLPMVPTRLDNRRDEKIALALVRRYGDAVLATTRPEHRQRLLALASVRLGPETEKP